MFSETDYRRGRNVVSALHAHLVFVTKYRRNVLTDELLTRCEEIMREVCADFEATLMTFNGEDDHIRLLIEYLPKLALSKLVNSLKGVCARKLRFEYTGWVNRHSMHGHFWSPSYFACSAGEDPLARIKEYIEQQRRPPRGQGRPKLMR